MFGSVSFSFILSIPFFFFVLLHFLFQLQFVNIFSIAVLFCNDDLVCIAFNQQTPCARIPNPNTNERLILFMLIRNSFVVEWKWRLTIVNRVYSITRDYLAIQIIAEFDSLIFEKDVSKNLCVSIKIPTIQIVDDNCLKLITMLSNLTTINRKEGLIFIISQPSVEILIVSFYAYAQISCIS